jgi:hypothetical protein
MAGEWRNVSGVDEGLDLSGVWHGFYNYPIAKEPVPFTATLVDTDGSLGGATEEVGNMGDAAGVTMTATLQGRRSGSSVVWLKIYDGDFVHYDAVRYEGAVSEDGLEIEGRWTVPGNWSGTFLMIRAGGVGKALEVEVGAPV